MNFRLYPIIAIAGVLGLGMSCSQDSKDSSSGSADGSVNYPPTTYTSTSTDTNIYTNTVVNTSTVTDTGTGTGTSTSTTQLLNKSFDGESTKPSDLSYSATGYWYMLDNTMLAVQTPLGNSANIYAVKTGLSLPTNYYVNVGLFYDPERFPIAYGESTVLLDYSDALNYKWARFKFSYSGGVKQIQCSAGKVVSGASTTMKAYATCYTFASSNNVAKVSLKVNDKTLAFYFDGVYASPHQLTFDDKLDVGGIGLMIPGDSKFAAYDYLIVTPQ